MPPLIIASSTKKTRLSRIAGDSNSRQPTASRHPSSRGAGGRLDFRAIAHRQQQRRHRKTENAGADEGAAPAPQALHHQEARRRHRRSQHAGEGVHRERLADAVGRNMVREQRVVGRVVDRVADAGEREHRHHQPERMDQPDDHEGAGADHQPGDQQDARAQPIDQEPGRRLQRGRDDVEGGEARSRSRYSSRHSRRARRATAAPAAGCNNARRNAPR